MGGNVPDRCHRHLLHTIHLIRHQGHASAGVHQEIPGNIYDITDYSAGCRHHARAVPVQKDIAHGICRDGDGIQRTVDIRQKVVKRYHGRVHTRLHRVIVGLGDSQELDAVTELSCKCNIQRRDL